MFTECCFFSSDPILSSVAPFLLHPAFSTLVGVTHVFCVVLDGEYFSGSILPYLSECNRPLPPSPSPQCFFVSVTLHSSGFFLRSFMGSEVWAQPWVSSQHFLHSLPRHLISPALMLPCVPRTPKLLYPVSSSWMSQRHLRFQMARPKLLLSQLSICPPLNLIPRYPKTWQSPFSPS